MPGMQPNLSLYLLFGGYTGLLLLILGAVLLRGAILLLEVRTGQLAHATGQITLSGGAYHAQVPGRRLDLTGLYYLPGDYVFYFLPRSGQVASAELAPSDRSYSAEPAPTGLAKTMARPQQPALTDDQLLHALAKTNHFSLGDLAAYREAKLGWSGLREMLKTTSSVVLMLICGLVAVATWLYVIVPILISIPRHPLMTTLLELAITAPLAIPSLYVALTMAWSVLETSFDVLGGRVVSVEGEVVARSESRLVSGGRYGGSHMAVFYYYRMADQQLAYGRLNDHNWDVSEAAHDALVEGRKYRVYYLPRSMDLMGIEPMAEG